MCVIDNDDGKPIDPKGMTYDRQVHIFLGEDDGAGNVKGFHCNKRMKDENVYATDYAYPRSREIVMYNRHQQLFTGKVYGKNSHSAKPANGGMSSFFRKNWTRQEVVDCIARSIPNGPIIDPKTNNPFNNVYKDPFTNLLMVNVGTTAFPILRY